MDAQQRIAQFQNMAQADPDNEMAHFSLGGALAQAGRHAEAAASYLRCAELVPGMSKAYQLAAESLLKAGEEDRAAELAARGYTVAVERGDVMPRDALAGLLTRLGRAIPRVAAPTPRGSGPGDVDLLAGAPRRAAAPGTPDGSFVCRRTGRPGTRLPAPPFRGRLGAWIVQNISAETWNAWIGQGTKVINELRLDLSRDEDEQTYDAHMREYLGIDDELYRRIGAGEA
ncbi:MAG TPA: Fe(2+)-trafficking protein [Phycisphaerales bacterium]|nr:Fe(2+)-trafficking protein [Phycisphaerales bacterium]